MKILFITTHNLATNPRVLKEIKLACANGYDVSVVMFAFYNWSKKLNDVLLEELKNSASLYLISAGRRPFLPWLVASFAHAIAGPLLNVFSSDKRLLSLYANKNSLLLMWKLKKIAKADLVVAHNVGAFYPAYSFARRHRIPFAVDIEDYHAGETADSKKAARIKKLCNAVLPFAHYLTAASPLILAYTLKDIRPYRRKTIVINNCFSKNEFTEPQPGTEPKLRMVWFSQNIDVGRGLEQILPVLKELNGKAELHLYGNLNPAFYDSYLKTVENVVVHPPLSQPELHKALSRYDVGLAIEPNKDVNNSVAVSNKINAYWQAGLYVIASDTPAQAGWMEERKQAGRIVCLSDKKQTTDELLRCFDSLEHLRSGAKKRFKEAQANCWEVESQHLLRLWENTNDKEVIPLVVDVAG